LQRLIALIVQYWFGNQHHGFSTAGLQEAAFVGGMVVMNRQGSMVSSHWLIWQRLSPSTASFTPLNIANLFSCGPANQAGAIRVSSPEARLPMICADRRLRSFLTVSSSHTSIDGTPCLQARSSKSFH
jgi:hypothetical protein